MTETIQIITALISGVAIVFVAIINMIANKGRKAYEQDQRERSKREEKREQILLQLLKESHANGELTHATALAVKRGHTNGEMDKALALFEAVKADDNEMVERDKAHSFSQTQTVTIGNDKAVSGKTIRACIIICFAFVIIAFLLVAAYTDWQARENYEVLMEAARIEILNEMVVK